MACENTPGKPIIIFRTERPHPFDPEDSENLATKKFVIFRPAEFGEDPPTVEEYDLQGDIPDDLLVD